MSRSGGGRSGDVGGGGLCGSPGRRRNRSQISSSRMGGEVPVMASLICGAAAAAGNLTGPPPLTVGEYSISGPK